MDDQCTNDSGKRSISEDSDDHSKKLKTECEFDSIKKEETGSDQADSSSILKGKAKKMIMMLSYCGKGYFGMQRNHGVKTIEEELLSAMLKAGVITHDRYEKSQLMHFQRAARTDKGVSAARQIVSLKLPATEDTRTIINKINEHLCPQIRVMGLKRGTKNFNAKLSCDARVYSYIVPTFAFTSINENDIEKFRISDSSIEKVNEILKKFEGTHNFHNFTAGRKHSEASANRYIMLFQCEKPFVQCNMEFVLIKVKGQSFMLHQIRKMIGLVIAIVRGVTDENTLDAAWGPDKIDIPIAPSIGLMLEDVCYEKYNKRYGKDGIHEPLEWAECEEEVNSFKEQHIYPYIISKEKSEKSMLKWLHTLKDHTYTVRESKAIEEDKADTDEKSE